MKKIISLGLIVLLCIVSFSTVGFAEDTLKLTEQQGRIVQKVFRLEGQLQYINFLINTMVQQKADVTIEQTKLTAQLTEIAKQIAKNKETEKDGSKDDTRTDNRQTD